MPGDAFKEIPKLAGTFDFVFLDAWKRDYKRSSTWSCRASTARGLFLAHNVVNKQSEMRDFLARSRTNPALAHDHRDASGRRNVGVGEVRRHQGRSVAV